MRNRTLCLGLVIGVAIAAVALAVVHLRTPRGPVVYAEVSMAPGLREGAPVLFRGVAVGQVAHIGFVPAGVRLTLALSRPDVPLRQGDGVRVRPNGMLANVALEIVPSAGAAAAARPGTVLHEAPPDSALLHDRALREALARRLGIRLAPDLPTKPR